MERGARWGAGRWGYHPRPVRPRQLRCRRSSGRTWRQATARLPESPGDADDAQGIAAFMQYGYADADVSEVHHHFGIGAAWTGAIPTRDEDSFGLLVSWVDLSDHPAAGLPKNEAALEFFYRWQLAPFFSLWGDLQYVVNPGGAADHGDALVGTLRTEISF